MMNISPVSASSYSSSVQANSDASSAALNYNAFLQLLMAEMQNQDPTQPMDPTQSLSQLASFSAVEQSIKTNAKLDNMLTLQSLGEANALIGRTLTSADGSVNGVVKSIIVNSDATLAVLDSGTVVALGSGIKVS
jgi:flagellar basal-body rod modification protein FlgD